MAFESNFGGYFASNWGEPKQQQQQQQQATPQPAAVTAAAPAPTPTPASQPWMWTRGQNLKGSASGLPRTYNPHYLGFTLTPVEEIFYGNNHREFYNRAVRELGYTADSPFGQFMFSQFPEIDSQFATYGLTHPDATFTGWARNPIAWLQDRFLNLDARSRGVNPQQFGGGFAGRPNFRG